MTCRRAIKTPSKRARQYKHIKTSKYYKKKGYGLKRRKRIAGGVAYGRRTRR